MYFPRCTDQRETLREDNTDSEALLSLTNYNILSQKYLNLHPRLDHLHLPWCTDHRTTASALHLWIVRECRTLLLLIEKEMIGTSDHLHISSAAAVQLWIGRECRGFNLMWPCNGLQVQLWITTTGQSSSSSSPYFQSNLDNYLRYTHKYNQTFKCTSLQLKGCLVTDKLSDTGRSFW